MRILLLAALTAGAGLWLALKVNRGELIGGLAVGKEAPPISAAGWLNGPGPRAADLRGRVVLVSAWGNHCHWCEKEAPELLALHKQFHDQVVFIGLTDVGLDELAGDNFVKRHHLDWPNGYGAIETLTAFDCEAYPMVWIIGADGKVVWNIDSERQSGISLEQGLQRAVAARKS